MDIGDCNNAAIIIRNASKIYGSKQNVYTVFENLNMTVWNGQIYGLLGPSGCGKTTLLNCILGMKQLNSGDIWVLGEKPGTSECGIPGPLVGYMPQEISLMKDFTVRDAVYYFGRIFELSETKIDERFEFLTKLLDLPPSGKFIKDCSGGQQRRVSFAAALVHEPELLILDEPTVGLDAILRGNIWDYLVDLTRNQGVTVIITTHYIDEAQRADCIGLMRAGIIIAEEPPQCLLNRYNFKTLEEVFYKLSQNQNKREILVKVENKAIVAKKNSINESLESNINNLRLNSNGKNDMIRNSRKSKKKNKLYSFGRLKALLLKNFNQIVRNPIGVYFIFICPILQIFSFCYGIGLDPEEIKLAIVNDESTWENCRNYTKYNSVVKYNEREELCELFFVSCRFIELIDQKLITKIFYDDLNDAKQYVAGGNAIGVLHIAKNFTAASEIRLYEGFDADDYNLEASELQFFMDMTQWNVGLLLKTKMYDTFKKYVESLKRDCDDFVDSYQFPMRVKTIYGNLDDPNKIFLLPGALIISVFYMATMITNTVIIDDRLEGIWERSLVAGVTYGEILLTHFLAQFPLVLLQSIEFLIVQFYFFDLVIRGSMFLLFILLLFNGVCGMFNGLFISIVCPTHVTSHSAVFTITMLISFASGLIWPAEAMPECIKWAILAAPTTIPVNAARDIVNKGWSLLYFEVALGFVVLIVWIFIFAVLSYVVLKRKT